ncbi:MAG: hypothetical protein Q7T76_09320 [Ferruginibacter sp.]|nr:hypothetical protein [Ferruginibacter sp.]
MTKILSLVTIIVLSVINSFAQKLNVVVNYVEPQSNLDKQVIIYKPDQLLAWSDFQAKPNEASEAAAITNAGFGVKLAFKRIEQSAELLINVNCSFSRKDSWVKKNFKTAYILNHEQKHFDIAYIHTVVFINKLRKAQYTVSNYVSVIEKIYNETALEMSKMQNDYDIQTSHSRIPEKQSAWDLKISNQLTAALKEQSALPLDVNDQNRDL